MRLDTLEPAPAENELSTVALLGENVGGAAPANGQTVKQHVVTAGQSLSGIAAEYGLSMTSIVDKNTNLMESTVLHVGQVLVIPDHELSEADRAKVNAEWKAKTASVAKPKTSSSSSASGSSATVTKQAASVPVEVASAGQSFADPIPGRHYVSQGFSYVHSGTDFAADSGTAVYAVTDGCITLASKGYNGGYGTTLMINLGGGIEVRYAHLSKFAPGISAGTCVTRGQLIAQSGDTGRSTGPHLHFEVHVNGVPVNPQKYL